MRLAVTAMEDRFRRDATAPALPVALRRALEGLGPTFVKLGQALGQRRDLLPAAWIVELSRLQDAAAPFPGEEARRLVERALGRPIDDMFARFEVQPLAAASVAQVHRAQLRDGRDVVVKVLRPHVRAQIDQDMRVLLSLAGLATTLVPRLRERRTVELVHELWRNLRKETDLKEEARNIRRFARAFAGSPTVFIPDVVDGLSSADALVQAMSQGRRLEDPDLKPQADRLARGFVDFYMAQFFGVGLFHADPHPGNIFVMEDGRLCFHDFGAVGWLDRRSRQALMSFVQGFIHQDPEWLTQAAIDLGLIAASADRAAVAQGVEAILADLTGAPLEEWSIAAVMLAVARLGGGGAVALPPHLAALVRTVFTAEGSLRLLDPTLDVVQALTASGEELFVGKAGAALTDDSGLVRLKWEVAAAARAAPSLAAKALHRVQDQAGLAVPIRLPEVPDAVRRMSLGADRIALALVTLGLYVAASLLMQHSIGPRILGDLPLLAALGYGLALWFTLKLVRGIGRSGGP
ncbi:ABC1 kinase family protein [Phenylobacterium soli]|uniref:ABC1 kinase family protein n=1 Tax=Phenylobacterium soli TaxID=2170551 RepID=UPI001D047D2F|nr:AarF/UbiB family protein [Phenylobacterium soli]